MPTKEYKFIVNEALFYTQPLFKALNIFTNPEAPVEYPVPDPVQPSKSIYPTFPLAAAGI